MELEWEGIDKKCLCVHNASHYDTKTYKAQSGSCQFLHIIISVEE
jgi:hypothetical protein